MIKQWKVDGGVNSSFPLLSLKNGSVIQHIFSVWGLYPSDIHCRRPLAMVGYTPNDIVHAYTNTNLTCVR